MDHIYPKVVLYNVTLTSATQPSLMSCQSPFDLEPQSKRQKILNE